MVGKPTDAKHTDHWNNWIKIIDIFIDSDSAQNYSVLSMSKNRINSIVISKINFLFQFIIFIVLQIIITLMRIE